VSPKAHGGPPTYPIEAEHTLAVAEELEKRVVFLPHELMQRIERARTRENHLNENEFFCLLIELGLKNL